MGVLRIGPAQGMTNGWHFQVAAGSSTVGPGRAKVKDITPEEYDAWQAVIDDETLTEETPIGDRKDLHWSIAKGNVGTPALVPHAFEDGTGPSEEYALGLAVQIGGLYHNANNPTKKYISLQPLFVADNILFAPGEAGTAALWVAVRAQGDPWSQPLSTEAYRLQETVTHEGQLWVNTGSDANVWEPGVFGWEVV